MLHRSDLEEDIAVYIKDRVPKAKIRTVFDVGANRGWVTLQFLRAFPDCEVWAFEPVSSIHQAMQDNLARFTDANAFPRTHCIRGALGDQEGMAKVTAHPDVTVNRISEAGDGPTEDVRIQTGDQFCLDHGVSRIDYLKVDAEGYDLRVLRGFESMLGSGAIDFVQVEASMSDRNLEHDPFLAFADVLRGFGFSYFRFTNQASNEIPILSRADVVFIRDEAAVSYRDD